MGHTVGESIIIITIYAFCMQVAFGMDFSQDPYVQSMAGERGLPYLICNTLEGVMKSFRNPLQKVSTVKSLIYTLFLVNSKINASFKV